MSIRSEIEGALEFLETELIEDGAAPSFTWKGATVPCVPSGLEAGLVVEIGGKEYTVRLRLAVRKKNFLTADSTLVTIDSDLYTADSAVPQPVAGKTLVFRSKTYRIATAKESPARSHYILTLVDSNSGR